MKRKNKNTAKVWNRENDTLTVIPKSELAPGMIRMFIQGKGEVWCSDQEIEDIEFSHNRGHDLSEVRGIISEIKDAFDGYYTKSLDEWEAGFQKDMHPEREIAMWLFASRKMREHAPGEPTPRNKEVFSLIMNVMVNGLENALLTFTPEILTRAEIEAILAPSSED
jgi:hypothetical protein